MINFFCNLHLLNFASYFNSVMLLKDSKNNEGDFSLLGMNMDNNYLKERATKIGSFLWLKIGNAA